MFGDNFFDSSVPTGLDVFVLQIFPGSNLPGYSLLSLTGYWKYSYFSPSGTQENSCNFSPSGTQENSPAIHCREPGFYFIA